MSSSSKVDRICYVCGFDFDTEPENEKQNWPFIFCPCCCFEYGIEDLDIDCFTDKRSEWINDGLQFGYKLQPDKYKWDIEIALKQLKNLKKVNLLNYPGGYEMNPNYNTDIDIEDIRLHWQKAREGNSTPAGAGL